MKTKLILIFTLLFYSHFSFSYDTDWYWGFTLGSSTPNFHGSFGNTISTLSSDTAYSEITPVVAEGFLYFPYTSTGLLGVVSGGTGKQYTHATNTQLNQSFSQSILTLSWLESLGSKIGEGLLLRAEIGYGLAYQTTGSPTLPTSYTTGLSVRGGIGYGLPMGENYKFFIMLTAASSSANGGTSYYAITVGPFF